MWYSYVELDQNTITRNIVKLSLLTAITNSSESGPEQRLSAFIDEQTKEYTKNIGHWDHDIYFIT